MRSCRCASVSRTAEVIGENDPVPDFDLHCPLLSLPAAFKTDATNIPAAIPYLYVDPQKSRIGAKSSAALHIDLA